MYALGANAPKCIFDARATSGCVPGSSGPRDAALAVLPSDAAGARLRSEVRSGEKRKEVEHLTTFRFRRWVPELRPGWATRIGRQAACVHREQSVARWRAAGHAGDQSDLRQRSSGFVRKEDRGGREGEAGKILGKKAKEGWFPGQTKQGARGRREGTTGGKERMGG